MARVYFTIGASSGFGRALAEAVLARGDPAVVAARRGEILRGLVAPHADAALAVRLDGACTATVARPHGAGDVGVPVSRSEPQRTRRMEVHAARPGALPPAAHVTALQVCRGKARRPSARPESPGPPGQSFWPFRASPTNPAIRKPVMRAVCCSASASSASRVFSVRREGADNGGAVEVSCKGMPPQTRRNRCTVCG